MKAEIISIGTELLLGHIVNTNAAFLSQKLAEVGIDVYYQTTVGDNPSRLEESFEKAIERSDIVITSGGLGPTVDDITIETIARLTNKRLVLNKTILSDLKKYFKLRNVSLPHASIRQAYIPEDVKWIRNMVGTAPGLIVEYKSKLIILLPGPPREIEPMFIRDVAPYLKKRFKISTSIVSRSVKTTGLAESQVNALAKDLLDLKPPTTVGIYAKLGEVTLKIMAKAKDVAEAEIAITKIEKKIRTRLKDHIFGYNDETLEGAVAKLLIKKHLTLAIAESCTGGLVANRLTNVSGSSKYFLMGIISYSNESKIKLLRVSKDIIAKYGAVSRQVALHMANGIRNISSSDIGLAITGIAGPTGGTKTKPVGLVYIALVTNKKHIIKELRFKGSREEIKFQASQVALNMIRKLL